MLAAVSTGPRLVSGLLGLSFSFCAYRRGGGGFLELMKGVDVVWRGQRRNLLDENRRFHGARRCGVGWVWQTRKGRLRQETQGLFHEQWEAPQQLQQEVMEGL